MTLESDGPREDPPVARIRRLLTDGLGEPEIAAIRELLDAAFWDDEDERFTEDDWLHSIGGLHVVLDLAGEIVAHASVVERELRVAGQPLRTGYVEAVATAPAYQRRGYGTQVMRAGDYEWLPAGSDHGPQTTAEGCLLLIHSSLSDVLTS